MIPIPDKARIQSDSRQSYIRRRFQNKFQNFLGTKPLNIREIKGQYLHGIQTISRQPFLDMLKYTRCVLQSREDTTAVRVATS